MKYSYDEAQKTIFISWEEIARFLGHHHDGSPGDDKRLLDELVKDGHDWVLSPSVEGNCDDRGWVLSGEENN